MRWQQPGTARPREPGGGGPGGLRALQPRPRPRGGAEAASGGPEPREPAALRAPGWGSRGYPPPAPAWVGGWVPSHAPTRAANAPVLSGFWRFQGAGHAWLFPAPRGDSEHLPSELSSAKSNGRFFHGLLTEPEAKARTCGDGGDPGCGSRASPVSPQGTSPPRAHRGVCHHLLKELMSFLLREGVCVGGWTRTHTTCSSLAASCAAGRRWDRPPTVPSSLNYSMISQKC